MTSPLPSDLSNADLLALIERLQQQHRAEVEQHREQMGTLTATMHGLQRKIGSLESHPVPSSEGFHHPARESARRHILPLRPFGGRGTRIGVGLGLALLLLVAPSQSVVTHAGYEGSDSTAYGQGALSGNTGSYNSAFGVNSLHSSPSGYNNTASGAYTLYFNTTGNFNTSSGYAALYTNTSGNNNTASGANALESNTTGSDSTASGIRALLSNTTGDDNTASGYDALNNNTTGYENTASGSLVLASNTTGSFNTAVGYGAGYTYNSGNANTTGSNNTFIGYNSGPGVPDQLTNATAIGANAVVSQSNSIVLGGTGANTQRVGVGTTTPHSALQIAKGFLQLRPITGTPPAPEQCVTADDAGRLVVRTDGTINLYVCNGTSWIGK